MARKIVVTSGKGGVGKTTICANLGYSLASNGLKVLLMDADIGLNNLDVVLGMENKVVFDLVDVLNGKCRPKQALVQDFFVSNLYVLPSNQMYCKCDVSDRLQEVLLQLDDFFDYILIDCPAGIETGFLRAISCATESIIVTTPHLSAIRDADKVITILSSKGISNIGVIVNRVRGDLIMNGEMLKIDQIKKFLKQDILGVVPEDDYISLQLMSSGTLSKRAGAYLAFSSIVKKLHYGENKIYDCTQKYKGFLGGLKKSIRKWV